MRRGGHRRFSEAGCAGARCCCGAASPHRRDARAAAATLAHALVRRRRDATAALRAFSSALRLPPRGLLHAHAPPCGSQARRGVPVDAQRLSFGGAAVPDDAPLCLAGVRAHATLRLSLRTRGACPAAPRPAHLAPEGRCRAHKELARLLCAFRRASKLRPPAFGRRSLQGPFDAAVVPQAGR